MVKTFRYLYEEFPSPVDGKSTIHEWMKSVNPQEFQLDLIPKNVTFDSCSKAIINGHWDDYPEWYNKLDTVPRELIYCACKSLNITKMTRNMNKDLLSLVTQFVTADMNENGMKISSTTMAMLELNSVAGASQRALEAVRDWFNRQDVASMSIKRQGRYIGAVVNLFVLIAKNDTEGLVKNWVLDDM